MFNASNSRPNSRPNSRGSTPQTAAAGGGALPYPYGTDTATATASTSGGTTPARPLRAPEAPAPAPAGEGPAAAFNVEVRAWFALGSGVCCVSGQEESCGGAAIFDIPSLLCTLMQSDLQAQLRALREELAALAPLKQEVDALRGQLRELQQKQ